MSRLHTTLASLADVAAHFGVDCDPQLEFSPEVVEGSRGLVVRESNGRRVLQAMQWGFPRLTREMRERGDHHELLGLVADLTNPMWEKMVVDPRYRCLIVLTHFANPDGPQGERTRAWFSLADQPIMAWAGFCRNIPNMGPVYAGMTMTANSAIEPFNDRMPVLLDPSAYNEWLRCPIKGVLDFQFYRPIASDRMEIIKTDDLWRSGALPIQRSLL